MSIVLLLGQLGIDHSLRILVLAWNTDHLRVEYQILILADHVDLSLGSCEEVDEAFALPLLVLQVDEINQELLVNVGFIELMHL